MPSWEFTRFIWWMQTERRRPQTPRPSQPTWAVSLPLGCYHPHPPSPFITTQPETWYLFYHPTAGGRLSRPKHCSKGVQHMPKAVYHSGCRDEDKCPRWDSNVSSLTPQSGTSPLDHCNLQRHVGVNNLPKVVTRQRSGWESNLQPLRRESNALITGWVHPTDFKSKSSSNSTSTMQYEHALTYMYYKFTGLIR